METLRPPWLQYDVTTFFDRLSARLIHAKTLCQDVLILSFGESHLAFSMPQSAMKSLGESMVTLTTTRGRAQ